MKTKLLTILVAGIMSLGSGFAQAQPIYINVGAAGGTGTNPDANTLTKSMDQFQLYSNTTTVQYDTDGSGGLTVNDKFVDSGNANMSAPVGMTNPKDFEGIDVLSQITITWSGLAGKNTGFGIVGGNLIATTIYSPGSVFNFYYNEPASYDYGATVGSGDDTGFTAGTKVLELTLTSGTGTNKFDLLTGAFIEGASKLYGEVTFALDNFWWFTGADNIVGTADDRDFNDILGMTVPMIIKASNDQNTDKVAIRAVPGALYAIDSDHDGSMEFVVPEPGVLALLGIGLLGLGLGSRKSAKASS